MRLQSNCLMFHLSKPQNKDYIACMLSSSRFIVAIHSLVILARNWGKGPVCSKMIAASVDTNPVVIRRLMSSLESANLVKSVAGRTGGFALAKQSDQITLADIYQSVEDVTVFRMHKVDSHSDCPVAAQMAKILMPKLKLAEEALRLSLGNTTLKDVEATIQ
jgi:Rrf2 family protein